MVRTLELYKTCSEMLNFLPLIMILITLYHHHNFISDLKMLTKVMKNLNTLFHKIGIWTAEIMMMKYVKTWSFRSILTAFGIEISVV